MRAESASVECVAGPRAERVIGSVQGARPGPTLVVIGALHGNEPAGVEAAREVIAELAERGEENLAGRFAAYVGNTRAAGLGRDGPRYLETDLNRAFSEAKLDAARERDPSARSQEEHEALELIELLAAEIKMASGPVYLLDLHTTSSASAPFCVLQDSLAARRIALSLGVVVALGLEEGLLGLLIDYATNQHGMISVLVEGGQHDDPASARVLASVLRTVIGGVGIASRSEQTRARDAALVRESAGVRAGRVFDVLHREEVESDATMVPETVRSFERVRAGRDVICVHGDREIAAPISGVVLMPNRQKDPRVGDDAVFIARRVSPAWLRVSAMVRRWEWLHGLLPRVLPGVRRVPGDGQVLLVAPEIAAVLRRDLFHLLGYRILRAGEPGRYPGRRSFREGCGAAWGAVRKVVGGVFHGGEHAALPDERPEDWLVARRRLDLEPEPETVGPTWK